MASNVGNERFAKRARLSTETGGTVHISFPFYDPEYGEIRATEGRSVRMGSYVGAAITNQINVIASSSSAWFAAQSWAPIDSSEYALEVNGESFASECAANIVVELPPVEEPTKKKKRAARSRVSVSTSFSFETIPVLKS